MLRAGKTTPPRLIRSLSGESLSPPPVWLMRQAGRYLPEYREVRAKAGGFLNLCYTPKLACEVTLQPIRRFGFDAAILFSDILVVPDALGQKVSFEEGEGPVLQAIGSGREIARLEPGKVLERLSPVFEAVQRIRVALPEETALIGFCGAPWTVATYMIGGRGSPDQAAARLFAYRQEQDFSRLMDILVEVSSDYLLRQVEAGAQALQVFDSWAGNLPEDEFVRWCVEPLRKIIARVKVAAPEVPVIAFPRGAGPRYEGFAAATSADAVACDTALPLAFIRDRLQQGSAVQGNLDPMLLVAGGEAMERRVRMIVDTLGARPFVFNLGHGIVPQTPVDNVARLVELVREPR